jgi:hypothetical protein
MSSLALQRITLFKNDLGFFERVSLVPKESKGSMLFKLEVPEPEKQLVIDTLTVSAGGTKFLC